MKKYITYIIITILLVVIAIGGTYMFMDKQNNKTEEKEPNTKVEDNKNIVLNDGIKFLGTEEIDDIYEHKMVQKYQVILNGKENIIEVIFAYYKNFDLGGSEDVIGTINGYTVCYFSKPELNSSVDELLNPTRLSKEFYTNNFKIITGVDNKNYLAIISNTNSTGYTELDVAMYIYNDNLELISKNLDNFRGAPNKNNYFTISLGTTNIILENENIWYKNNFNICNLSNDCKINLKIENNKIFYLYPQINFSSSNDYGYLEEREYTINNDKLEYKALNKYKVKGVAGAVW